MERTCPNCGAQCGEAAKFCNACGVKLNNEAVRYKPDNGFVENFLRYDNRINRKRYIKRTLALLGVAAVIVVAVSIVLAIGGVGDQTGDEIIDWLTLTLMSPGIFLSMRRFHDLDKPGWWALGSFIPLLNIVVELYLLFAKGTDGANQFGPDPLGKE